MTVLRATGRLSASAHGQVDQAHRAAAELAHEVVAGDGLSHCGSRLASWHRDRVIRIGSGRRSSALRRQQAAPQVGRRRAAYGGCGRAARRGGRRIGRWPPERADGRGLRPGLRRRDGGLFAGAAGAGRDGHLQHGLAGLDRVAVVQVDALDPLAVDVGAVAAAHVHEAAVRRVDFHEEMDAREIAVLARQAEMGAPSSGRREKCRGRRRRRPGPGAAPR